jgi:hypothetical protein
LHGSPIVAAAPAGEHAVAAPPKSYRIVLRDRDSRAREIDVRDGQVQVPVSITPVFISPLASV